MSLLSLDMTLQRPTVTVGNADGKWEAISIPEFESLDYEEAPAAAPAS